MLNKAKAFAMKAHGEQKYGDEPYIVHLEAVVANLESYGEKAQIIGYLHDVIEDTEVGYQDVKNVFGDLIANCVAIVTDEEGQNRKERKARTYKKMSKVTGELELALIVKAADRLANIRACVKDGNERLLSMYKGEHPVFRSSVYREGLCEDIWHDIERLI